MEKQKTVMVSIKTVLTAIHIISEIQLLYLFVVWVYTSEKEHKYTHFLTQFGFKLIHCQQVKVNQLLFTCSDRFDKTSRYNIQKQAAIQLFQTLVGKAAIVLMFLSFNDKLMSQIWFFLLKECVVRKSKDSTIICLENRMPKIYF